QLCAMKLSPKSYMDFIVCQNKDIRNADSNWESCAEEANIDVEALRTCSEGNEGIQLHSTSVAKANAAQAMGSPTIFIDGQSYVGGRDPISFKMAICSLLNEHPKCSEMPECISNAECNAEPGKVGQCIENECQYTEDATFEVIVINDETCGAQCNPGQILATTQQLFLGATFKMLDVSDAEAQELIERLGLEFVPAYLFGEDVTKTFMWQNRPELQGSFEKRQEFWKLLDEASGASQWINAEARLAYEEEMAKLKEKQNKALGVTKGNNKPTVNLFVMSQCPFGVLAENALKPVLDALGDNIDFKLDFIANPSGEGFQSLHGQPEVEEDLRQVCAIKIAPNSYMDYIICQNEDIGNAGVTWESCAEKTNINVEALRTCSEESEGKELLLESIGLTNLLGISASPSIFVDGEKISVDIRLPSAPSAFKSLICAVFDDAPEECDGAIQNIAQNNGATPECGV
ncbi:MAG: hypothetical protein KKB39_01460, partial [Nanoarchaeota archaeon]|nr:hypothetical protein [Nanoarchaeota archaeon]